VLAFLSIPAGALILFVTVWVAEVVEVNLVLGLVVDVGVEMVTVPGSLGAAAGSCRTTEPAGVDTAPELAPLPGLLMGRGSVFRSGMGIGSRAAVLLVVTTPLAALGLELLSKDADTDCPISKILLLVASVEAGSASSSMTKRVRDLMLMDLLRRKSYTPG